MSAEVRVAVMVPARNAMATLPACLEALMGSSCKPDQIVVYDDGLNPNIGALAKPGLISIVSNDGVRVGRARARNLAARQATAEILAFVDADVVVGKDALGRLVAAVGSEPGIVAAFGCYDQAPRVKRLVGLYANLRHHWIHQQGDLEAATFWTGVGVVRADAFWSLDGFDEAAKLEDIDFGMRLSAAGKRIRLVPEAQGSHLKDWRLLQLWWTDIVDRAYPWSLLIARGARGNQLNAAPRERFSAILAYAFLMSLFGSFVMPRFGLAAAIFAGLYIYLNRGLFDLIARRGGARALCAGIVLHWLYHLYASAIFIAVLLTAKLRAALSAVRSMLVRRVAPTVATARIQRKQSPRG
jgi:cellulose synthase/poly-beta-1,6-N-acetylglucosamine synthase-like glycosyltransferase